MGLFARQRQRRHPPTRESRSLMSTDRTYARGVDPTSNRELLATAHELDDLGFTLLPVGAKKVVALESHYLDNTPADLTEGALKQVREGAVSGLAFLRGPRSTRDRADGGCEFVGVLELEGRAVASEAFQGEWADAIEQLELGPVMGRLEAGWKETSPSGGVHWAFTVPVPDPDYVEHLKAGLPTLAARQKQPDGAVLCFAELLITNGYVVAAPSHGATHPTGKPWVREKGGPAAIPALTVRELSRLADLLVLVGDAKANPADPATSLDARTLIIRSRYDAAATDAATLELLVAAGWEVTNTHGDGELILHRGGHSEVKVGGTCRPPGSLYTFSESAAPLDAVKGFHTAFDVRVALTGTDAETLAEQLVFDGTVRPTISTLAPRDRRYIWVSNTDSDSLTRVVATEIADAKHPDDSGAPFVLSEVGEQGEPRGLLTVDRQGVIRRWRPSESKALALRVVQPVHGNEKDGITFEHDLPALIVEAAVEVAKTSARTSPVRYIGTAPVLLPSGETLSTPGYHAAKRALVVIPRRDRRTWDTYHVPERPTTADAQASLDYLLDELLGDFPFETPPDRIRAVLMLLTMASRDLYGTCPAFLVSAHDRGSGKGLLCSLMRRIASSHSTPESIGYARKEDNEIEKRMVSATLEGRRYLHVDELPREDRVTSRKISELITSDGDMTSRILGGNSSVSIARMVLTVCGNNAELADDGTRRFLSVNLAVPTGIASERTGWRHPDLTTWVRDNRATLLAAAHTVLSHGLQAPPASYPAYGSFERWSSVILQSLAYVTVDGVNAAELAFSDRQEKADQQDAEGLEWLPVMQGWVREFAGQWVSPSTAVEKLTGRGKVDELPVDLLPRAEQGPAGQARSWGRALTRRRGTAVRSDGLIYRIALQRSARGNAYRVSVEEERKVAPLSAPPTPAAKPKAGTARTQPWEDTFNPSLDALDALDALDHDPYEDWVTPLPAPVVPTPQTKAKNTTPPKAKTPAKAAKVTPIPVARPSIDSLTIIELA